MINNAKTITEVTNKIYAEQEKQREEAQKASREKIEAQKAKRLNEAKNHINEEREKLEQAKKKYEDEKKKYDKAKEDYDKLSPEEQANAPVPVLPLNPDETLLDGITLTKILSELEERLKNPHSSQVNNLGNGWYCGPSSVSDVVINNNPEGYVTAIIDLVTKGEGKFFPESKKIQLPKHLKNATITELNAWGDEMYTLDLVFGGTIRHKHNGMLKNMFRKNSMPNNKKAPEKHTILGFARSSVYEGTFPSQTEKMLKTCGLQVDKKKLKRRSSIKDLKIIESAVASGLTPIVLDNYLIKRGEVNPGDQNVVRRKGKHYLPIYEFKFFIDADGVEKIKIQFWEYGALQDPVIRTVEQVIGGMKGYWIPDFPDK